MPRHRARRMNVGQVDVETCARRDRASLSIFNAPDRTGEASRVLSASPILFASGVLRDPWISAPHGSTSAVRRFARCRRLSLLIHWTAPCGWPERDPAHAREVAISLRTVQVASGGSSTPSVDIVQRPSVRTAHTSAEATRFRMARSERPGSVEATEASGTAETIERVGELPDTRHFDCGDLQEGVCFSRGRPHRELGTALSGHVASRFVKIAERCPTACRAPFSCKHSDGPAQASRPRTTLVANRGAAASRYT